VSTSSGPSVLLLGATGLVGRECLRLLAGDPAFGRVVALTRRPIPPALMPATGAGKVDQQVVDFDRLERYEDAMRVDQVICALGTTIRAAGSRARFRQVDLGYPLEIARLARGQGADHFLLVSAIGASSRSRFFYNRVKGELEEAISALPYPRVTIVRPSLLLGAREEVRIGERVAEKLSFLFPGRWRPVRATAVAAALVLAAREDRVGQRVVESREIDGLAARYAEAVAG
jgi:uncharacterized protein YbjT (DUF2867 family)